MPISLTTLLATPSSIFCSRASYCWENLPLVAQFEVSDRLAELIGKSLHEICGGLTASEGKLRHANLKLTLQDVLK
jgi:regulator of PEP synthase PpsR (kinase-PPPase family)